MQCPGSAVIYLNFDHTHVHPYLEEIDSLLIQTGPEEDPYNQAPTPSTNTTNTNTRPVPQLQNRGEVTFFLTIDHITPPSRWQLAQSLVVKVAQQRRQMLAQLGVDAEVDAYAYITQRSDGKNDSALFWEYHFDELGYAYMWHAALAHARMQQVGGGGRRVE